MLAVAIPIVRKWIGFWHRMNNLKGEINILLKIQCWNAVKTEIWALQPSRPDFVSNIFFKLVGFEKKVYLCLIHFIFEVF